VPEDPAGSESTQPQALRLPARVASHLSDHSRSFLFTLRGDGSPTAHPMTALLSDGRLVFNTYRKSAKARNLERDPRAAALLLENYGAEAVEELRGFVVHGRGATLEVQESVERSEQGPKVSEGQKERVAERLATGKRILIHLSNESDAALKGS